MVNYEKHILKAMSKIRKEYLTEWDKSVHEHIYVELDTISIFYEDDCSWADVKVRWGREDTSYHNELTIPVYPKNFKYLVGYILGMITYQETICVEE